MSLIKTNNIVISDDRIRIKIPDSIKSSGPGKEQPLLNLPLFENKNVCIASALQYYIDKTRDLRKNNDNKLLFISFKKLHNPVCKDTLSHWAKKVLEKSGIDTNIFSSHSTRHASTSTALLRGVNIETIRDTAGWTKDSITFANFYNLPIFDKQDAFANVILGL